MAERTAASPWPDPGSGARHAVVLSGGGAKGAYEVGVMQALFAGASPATDGLPLTAGIFTGTSVGAYNAAFMAQSVPAGRAAVDALAALWCERIADTSRSCGNGVYRLRADPLQYLEPGCLRRPFEIAAEIGRDTAFWARYLVSRGAALVTSQESLRTRLLETFDLAALFSVDPLSDLVAETLDFARLAAAPGALTVVASDWTHGTVRLFGKEEVARLGSPVLLGATAIPGIFPPVDVAGMLCADGGLLMNTPLGPAIDDGADVLHVIYVDPRVIDIPFPPLPNTLDTFYRLYATLLAAQVNNDIGVAARINEEMAMLAVLGVLDVLEGGRDWAPAARRLLRPLSRVVERLERGRPYRPLAIHRYRPQADLAGAESFLDFSAAAIETLMAAGYADAVAHDCRTADCILPPAPLAPAGPVEVS